MQLFVAEKAGFCFGVKNAVEKAYSLANSKKNVYTLGPIIHNKTVVKDLSDAGIKAIEDINSLNENDTVIIRSHGVSKEIYKMLEDKKVEVIDATCPNVKNIHNIVLKRHEEGYTIVIIGDENHPEVKGINGWCSNEAIIVNSKEDIIKRFNKQYEKLCIVSQTTFSIDKWYEMIYDLLKFSRQVLIYNTICSATEQRQKEACELSKKVDAMVVIGSSESSNTQKLYDVCMKNCKNVIFAEDANDINSVQLENVKTIGVTAGASTPQVIINEVIDKLNRKEDDKMDNENEKKEDVTLKDETSNNEDESMQDFMKGFKDVHEGAEIKGKVILVNEHETFLDIGYKSDAVLTAEEMTNPEVNMKDLFKTDDVIDVKVVRMNNGEGNVLVSRKYIDYEETLNKLKDSKDKKEIIEVYVKGTNKGGFDCSYNRVNAFMPFSLSGLRKDEDHNILVGKTVRSIITDINNKRNNVEIVITRKEVLREERKEKVNSFIENAHEGDEGSGIVKTIIPQGCFIDTGSVDVFVPVSEISYKRGLKAEEMVHVGDAVKYVMIRVDSEKKRVTGSIKKLQKDPWEVFMGKYKEEDIAEGRVVSLTDFGAFVELVDGVDGLVHVSQISEKRVNKPKDVLKLNQIVKVKILKIDVENKKISLSMKEAVDKETEQVSDEASEK